MCIRDRLWRPSEELTMKADSVRTLTGGGAIKLCLRYKGRAYLMDEKCGQLTLGREISNDLVVEDRKASRLHARIERRGNKYLLIDQSTNGTYLVPKGEGEMLLRREEVMLQGSGVIRFGTSSPEGHLEQIEFEHM